MANHKTFPHGFSITPALMQRLVDYSKRTGVPMSRVVRFALVEYLDHMEQAQTQIVDRKENSHDPVPTP